MSWTGCMGRETCTSMHIKLRQFGHSQQQLIGVGMLLAWIHSTTLRQAAHNRLQRLERALLTPQSSGPARRISALSGRFWQTAIRIVLRLISQIHCWTIITNILAYTWQITRQALPLRDSSIRPWLFQSLKSSSICERARATTSTASLSAACARRYNESAGSP